MTHEAIAALENLVKRDLIKDKDGDHMEEVLSVLKNAKKKKRVYLWIDQYGNKFWAATRKDLARQIPGRVSVMYRDTKDGKTVKVGYVIGQNWCERFAPCPLD